MDINFLKNKIREVCDYHEDFEVKAYEADRLEVSFACNALEIGHSSISDFCRGISLAIANFRDGKTNFKIVQSPVIKSAGVMIDASYSGVVSVDGVKKYIDYMAASGLNLLMLYTEDTYEVKKYPQMGYQRGRYTREELKEIDAYAAKMGVELVGCIQTLGHMEHVVKWKAFSDIRENACLLLPGEEKTYEFIEECIKTISENIGSRRIHVGLDETFGLCEGDSKYKVKHGACNPLDVYTEHVNRVNAICEKYGLRPMMWSDCFFRYSMKETGYGVQYSADEPIPQEILDRVPKNMDMVYWEYELRDKEKYAAIINAHKVFGGETVMATANWNWDGQLPSVDYAFTTQGAALEAVKECGVNTAISTLWQSQEHADYLLSLPSVVFYGQHRYNDDASEKAVERLLRNNTGMELSAIKEMKVYHRNYEHIFFGGERYFQCSTLLNTVGQAHDNPDKAMKQAAENLRKYDSKRWNKHYEFSALILEIASIKCKIYNELHVEYKNNNNKYLKNLAEDVLPELIEKYKKALALRKEIWFATQKPYAFDRYVRLYGGCIADVRYTIDRLEDWLNGKAETIEELENVQEYQKVSQVGNYTKI